MGSIPRRTSEFDEIRSQLMALNVPIHFVEHHIDALHKAYQVRAKNRADRERREMMRIRTPVTKNSPDGCTMGPKRRPGRPKKEFLNASLW
jgi:hypothetical protein